MCTKGLGLGDTFDGGYAKVQKEVRAFGQPIFEFFLNFISLKSYQTENTS